MSNALISLASALMFVFRGNPSNENLIGTTTSSSTSVSGRLVGLRVGLRVGLLVGLFEGVVVGLLVGGSLASAFEQSTKP